MAKMISETSASRPFHHLFVKKICVNFKREANLYPKQFVSNCILNIPIKYSLHTVADVLYNMPEITFKVKYTRKTFELFVTNKSSGLDDIRPNIYLKFVLSNCPNFTRLFQISYVRGIFPHVWKAARIQRVPKKRSTTIMHSVIHKFLVHIF